MAVLRFGYFHHIPLVYVVGHMANYGTTLLRDIRPVSNLGRATGMISFFSAERQGICQLASDKGGGGVTHNSRRGRR